MFLLDAPGRRAIHNEDFVSVAITSFNRHDRLENLINSIHQHADMPFEIVVSDDGGALYSNFDFLNRIKARVSHVAVNTGRNKGLHVNTNNAVALTRSKYVVNMYDDTEVVRPFFRDSVNLLSNAPHVGIVYLDTRGNVNHSKFMCKTPDDQDYSVFCTVGSEWAAVFRKETWMEVGGYGEDDIYGDNVFLQRSWKKGYFCANLVGPERAVDKDKVRTSVGHWCASDTTGKFIKVGYANYPRLFGVTDAKLLEMDRERAHECSYWNHLECRGDDVDMDGINYEQMKKDLSQKSWRKYFEEVLKDGCVNWEMMQSLYHGRFLDTLKRDFVSVYNTPTFTHDGSALI